MWNLPQAANPSTGDEVIEEDTHVETIPLVLANALTENPRQLFEHIDKNGFNYLMLAASNGWTKITRDLLSLGFDANSTNGKVSAIALAYNNKHLNTVHVLLENNAKFPDNFDLAAVALHAGIADFAKMTRTFHDWLRSEDCEALAQMTAAKPNLRHFFALDGENFNRSAAFVAYKESKNAANHVLVQNYVLPSPDEDVGKFAAAKDKALKELHQQMHLPDPVHFVAVLSRSSFLGLDIDKYERQQRHFRVTKALAEINSRPEVSPVLQYVARAGFLRLVFDCDHDHEATVERGETFCGESGSGFHPTKHIHVGVREMLNAHIWNHEHVYGAVMRALCRYALEVQYKNGGKPYKQRPIVSLGRKAEFTRAMTQCEVNGHHEPAIGELFGRDSADRQFAKRELVSRVPQLVVKYSKDEAALRATRGHFALLFAYYERHVLADITEAIPHIDEKISKRQASFEERVSDSWLTRRRVKIAAAVLGIVVLFVLGLWVVRNANEAAKAREVSFTDCGHVKVAKTTGLIAGAGAKEAYPGQWPWLVPIFMYPHKNYLCGSTLITSFHLLTAAHCVSNETHILSFDIFFATIGHFDISNKNDPNAVARNFSALYAHASFRPDGRNYKSLGDIAVFRLAAKTSFSDLVQPACFPRPSVNTINVTGWVAGYGRFIAERMHETVPKHTRLTTVSERDCFFKRHEYVQIVSNMSFCAGESDATPCSGDSGSGFFVKSADNRRFIVTGIVSQGLNAEICNPDDHVVFVNVVTLVDWVYEKISICGDGEECVSPCVLNPCGKNAHCIAKANGKFACKCFDKHTGDPTEKCS